MLLEISFKNCRLQNKFLASVLCITCMHSVVIHCPCTNFLISRRGLTCGERDLASPFSLYTTKLMSSVPFLPHISYTHRKGGSLGTRLDLIIALVTSKCKVSCTQLHLVQFHPMHLLVTRAINSVLHSQPYYYNWYAKFTDGCISKYFTLPTFRLIGTSEIVSNYYIETLLNYCNNNYYCTKCTHTGADQTNK